MAGNDKLDEFCAEAAEFVEELTEFFGGMTTLPDSAPVTNVQPDDPAVTKAIDGIAAAAEDLNLEP